MLERSPAGAVLSHLGLNPVSHRLQTLFAVDNKRLRKLQQLSQVERLLEAFVSRSRILPDESHQIRDSSAIPTGLRSIALRSAEEGRAWVCWTSGAHQWLFEAVLSLPLSREHDTPVLQVNRYSGDGQLIDAACWKTDPDGQWCRCGG